VVRGVREIRALHNIPLSRKLEARIKADGRSAAILRRMGHFVSHLGALQALEIGPGVVRPETAVGQVVGDVEIYLLGVIDPEKERKRLQNRRTKLVEDGLKAEAKLSNEGFLARAPADVVEKERQKLRDLMSEIELIDANLRAL
jgi:valyl-tRNA synthetase